MLNDLSIIFLQLGKIRIRLETDIPSVSQNVSMLYDRFLKCNKEQRAEFIDFNVRVMRARGLRRWYHSQANFYFDQFLPFAPLPLGQAVPMFEWGLNWCIANHYHRLLHIHAACVERDGVTVVLPADPGSGKSTLTAILMNEGWRLITDELVMIDPETLKVFPLSRPINLKNHSITLMERNYPQAVLTARFEDTAKGTVALMRPSKESSDRVDEHCQITHIVSPKYTENRSLGLEPISKPEAFMHLIRNSFNYHVLGELGFRIACSLVDQSSCYKLEYSNKDELLRAFEGFRRAF